MGRRSPTRAALVVVAALGPLLASCSSSVDDGVEPASCEGFADQPAEQPVAVVIHNDTISPLYLSGPSCATVITLLVTDPTGARRTWRDEGLCSFSCQELQTQLPDCPTICPIPPVIYLAPGGSYTETWTGLIDQARSMPADCWAAPVMAGDQGCLQRVVAPSGEYALTARAWADLHGCDGGSCWCQPDASGSCAIEGSEFVVDGTQRDASAVVSYPGEATVAIVFD